MKEGFINVKLGKGYLKCINLDEDCVENGNMNTESRQQIINRKL